MNKAKKVIGKLNYIFQMTAVKERGDMDDKSVKSAMIELAKDAFRAGKSGHYKTFTSYKRTLNPKIK